MRKSLLCVMFACVAAHAQTSLDLPDERGQYHEAHVFHIMLRSEQDARTVHSSLQAVPVQRLFSEFKATAIAKSIDPGSRQSGGDLGVVKEGTMVRPFEKAAFALSPGQMSPPVQTVFGWHVLYVASAKAVPVAVICEQTLSAHSRSNPDTLGKAVALSRSFKVGEPDLDVKVLEVLGPEWGPPLKDMEGRLSFIKVGKTDVAGNTEVVQHSEHSYARLHIAPLVCKRAEQIRFQVNCKSETVQMKSLEEFELRGGRGPVVNRTAFKARPAHEKSQYGGFYQQLLGLACKADLKT